MQNVALLVDHSSSLQKHTFQIVYPSELKETRKKNNMEEDGKDKEEKMDLDQEPGQEPKVDDSEKKGDADVNIDKKEEKSEEEKEFLTKLYKFMAEERR